MAEQVALCTAPTDAVEKLLDDAFGIDRHQKTAYLLRQVTAVIDRLSFAILDGQPLVGSIQCWPVAIDTTSLILVGPVAVSPHRQNQGIGRQLMSATFSALKPADPPMVMIGDPNYYRRFGFLAVETGGWTLPGPWETERLLLRNPLHQRLPKFGMVGPRYPTAFDA